MTHWFGMRDHRQALTEPDITRDIKTAAERRFLLKFRLYNDLCRELYVYNEKYLALALSLQPKS